MGLYARSLVVQAAHLPGRTQPEWGGFVGARVFLAFRELVEVLLFPFGLSSVWFAERTFAPSNPRHFGTS